jgi:hypothetical protein
MYLDSLCTIGSGDLLVASGYSVVSKSVVSGQMLEANRLSHLWLDVVHKAFDLESVRRFMHERALANHFWAATKLSEDILTRGDLSPSLRFEMEATHYVALQGSQALCDNPRGHKDRRSMSEVNWIIHSIGTNRLNDLVSASRISARQEFDKLTAPTQAQISVARQLGLTAPPLKQEQFHDD